MTSRLDSCCAESCDFAHLREAIEKVGRKLVVLDDDSSDTHTVHGLEVFTEWPVETLVSALLDPRPAFFILTNSRARTEPEAVALKVGIARNLEAAEARTGVAFTIASRSNSTLRRHYPAEMDALRAARVGPVDGVVVIPAFFEGNRFTIDDFHCLAETNQLVPVSETELARDTAFGYRHSSLRQWIEEKTDGRVCAGEVASISLDVLHQGGAAAVHELLGRLESGRHVIVNAAGYADLGVFVRGLLEMERSGKRLLFRTAASFVRVRAGIARRALLLPDEIAPRDGPGLIVVGSYLSRTTVQLQAALGLPGIRHVAVAVGELGEPSHCHAEVGRVAAMADQALAAGEARAHLLQPRSKFDNWPGGGSGGGGARFPSTRGHCSLDHAAPWLRYCERRHHFIRLGRAWIWCPARYNLGASRSGNSGLALGRGEHTGRNRVCRLSRQRRHAPDSA